MTPRSLEILTVLDFIDRANHYLQNWKGQLTFKEGETINLRGNLGISNCRPGSYEVHSDIPASQLSLDAEKPDVLYKFYKCTRLE